MLLIINICIVFVNKSFGLIFLQVMKLICENTIKVLIRF